MVRRACTCIPASGELGAEIQESGVLHRGGAYPAFGREGSAGRLAGRQDSGGRQVQRWAPGED